MSLNGVLKNGSKTNQQINTNHKPEAQTAVGGAAEVEAGRGACALTVISFPPSVGPRDDSVHLWSSWDSFGKHPLNPCQANGVTEPGYVPRASKALGLH